MSGRREIELLLREWVRGVIGLEEMALLGEDAYSQKIDGVVASDDEPNISNLTLLRLSNPTAAKAQIRKVLKKSATDSTTGKVDFDAAAEALPREAGEESGSGRTLRRNTNKVFGHKAAKKLVDQINAEVAGADDNRSGDDDNRSGDEGNREE